MGEGGVGGREFVDVKCDKLRTVQLFGVDQMLTI